MRPATLATAALGVAAATPVAMVLSRGVAPVMLAIAAALLALAAVGEGRGGEARRRLAEFARAPAGLLALGALAYMALSLAWSPAVARGAEFTGHVAGSVLLIAVAIAALRAAPPDAGVRSGALGALLAAAAALTLVELWAGSPLRTAFGASTEPFRLNRAAVAIALVLPLAATLLVRDGRRLVAGALVVLAAAAVFASDSESAKLALVVLVPAWALGRLAPRAAAALGAVAIASLLAAPAIAPVVNALVPQALHDAIGYFTLGVRGEIWTRYAWLVVERPVLGHGMEAGHVAATMMAGTLDPGDLSLLDFGHPHNFALQVWFELGLIGVAFAVVLLAFAARALGTAPASLRPAAIATAAAVWAVAFVSHGAWQAWWWCLVGLVAVLFQAAVRHGAGEPADRAVDTRRSGGAA